MDNTPWKLNVSSLAGQAVDHVDVKDSDAMAGVGTAVSALYATDSGGNTNWIFLAGGQTNEWTGGSNTAWATSANWSLGRAPISDDFVKIPAAKPRYPVLGLAITVNGLELQTGASLDLNGQDLTVTSDAMLAGTFRASGSETITFQAGVDFTGGTFTPVQSKVSLAGSGDQFVNLADLTFFKIAVLNSLGSVNFVNGFTATEFRCEAPSGTRTMTFQQGRTFIIRDLFLLGAAGATNITLWSSDYGLKWNLAVSGYRSVRGVEVQDSNASMGLPIPAASSQDDGNNDNWLFGVAPAVWLGTVNNNFHTATNWAPAVVPDATARVLVDGTNSMTITGAVTVLELTVGGGAGAAVVTVNAPLTVGENIAVITNGTLALNRPSVVSNNVEVLAGGILTHSANGDTEVNKLTLSVYGNVEVDTNGAIDVTAKGYPNYGPGSNDGKNAGGSHGGKGGEQFGLSGVCYGSIVAPTNLGSAGYYYGNRAAGGGAVRLTVSGVIDNRGLICADGAVAFVGSGSGGSINLSAGLLVGSGTIRANGGGSGSGGGGRVALVVTNVGADFSLYTGAIQATGTGAGTIYKQSSGDRPGRGTVYVQGGSYYTDVPPSSNYVAGEVDRATFYVDSAKLRLGNDVSVGDIFLPSAGAQLDLNFKTLIVHSRQHSLSGTVTNFGTIIWLPDVMGTVFSIR